jgi:hypothetical protein
MISAAEDVGGESVEIKQRKGEPLPYVIDRVLQVRCGCRRAGTKKSVLV